MKISIIGCGNMGLTYARSFIQYHKTNCNDLFLIAKNSEHAKKLEELNLGTVFNGITQEALNTDVLILSVKPQDFLNVASSITNKINKETLVISILAGIKLKHLQTALNHEIIVRAMPNMPAQYGMGITVYIPSEKTNIHHISTVENLLSTTGRTFMIEDENLMDGVTALSGSGPAYFYYIVMIMIETAKKMGFDESLASLLVKHTMHGAFHVINNSDLDLETLIKKVASKGGTTEAAFEILKKNNFAEILSSAILRAEERSRELARLNGLNNTGMN
ncbi:pyrroline-5-carboxylate reductase [Rosettibacter firmus]|uniref:pyrroline-5-carboxylate reductase n=1 Tax=Rosettibacter firmus TaxID=3111522 RepID=UPI00336BBF24